MEGLEPRLARAIACIIHVHVHVSRSRVCGEDCVSMHRHPESSSRLLVSEFLSLTRRMTSKAEELVKDMRIVSPMDGE